MKYATFNQNGLPTAFYDDGIHSIIPDNAIQITDEQWEEFINNQGLRKWNFNANAVVIFDPNELLTIDVLKRRLRDQVHQIRKDKEQQGIIVIGSGGTNQYPFDTSLTGRANMQGVFQAFQSGLFPAGATVHWKFKDGSFFDITQEQLQELAEFVIDYVERLFQAESAHFQAVDALAEKSDAEAYDVNTGWPSNEYQSQTLS